ncbi:MAG TPA: GAF domain-containing protein, partial [Chloroflexi bacterium]|nr:GAF domain-containing protein [Chloroflexota bacterium]
SSTLRLAGSVGLSERYRELSTAIDLDSAQARAVRAAETVVVEDTHTVPHLKEILDVVQAEGYRAVLEVPLRLSDKVIGTLSAYYPHPRRFEAGEIELMQTLGGQVAIAVENARLFEATLARQRELELLYEASASINASLSLQNVLRAVASSMMRALELDNWLALLPRDDEQTLDVALYMTREGEQLREGTLSHTDFVLGKLPTIREAIERQGPTTVQHREVTLSPDEARLLEECHFESCFILPMTVQGEPVGVIMAGTSHPRPEFEPTQLRLAWSLANQAAVAVQNARLFERTDIALSRRLGEIDALEQILQRMTRRLDLQAVIEHVALAAATATGSEIAEVLLLDEHSNMLRVAARRVFGEWVSAEDWPLDKGVTGQAVRTGEVILLNSVANDPHYVAAFESVCSELAVPIMLDKRCLGVINLESTRPFAYRTEHVRFVTTLAEHAAIAIENVRLFEAVRRRAEELDSLRTIAIELLSSMDMRHTLRVIARAALEHTQARDVHIYLYDRESDTLTFGTSLWASGEVDREFAKPRPNGLTALTARTGERHIITNPARHPLFADQVDKEGWELPIVSVPIQQRDEVVGVFNIAFDSATAINEDILGFLDLLAAQAAVAITTTRLVEQTRTGRDRLQAILDSIHDGILMFDVQGRLVMVNPRAMYLLNIRGEEFVGQHFARIARYLDRMLATESPAFSWEIIRELAGQIRESPYRITRRSYVLTRPVRRAIEEVSLPVTGRQNELLGRLFILRDVTQREEMEAFREEMSHMLVHDLRSPLSGVLTGLQMIKDELDAPPPDLDIIRTTTEIALDSANSMLRLVEAILDVNRLEAGKMALMLKPVSLKTLAQQAFQTLESVAAGADVEVRIEAPEDLPLISVDPDQIKRVMINLLDNALRYTPEGGQIRLIIEPFETYQKVSVIDTGEGIPPEYREKIFERFVQVESTRPKRGSKGSGLGLTFCRLVVEAHGGRIWVDEGPEGGAAFHFTLPVGLTLPPDRR